MTSSAGSLWRRLRLVSVGGFVGLGAVLAVALTACGGGKTAVFMDVSGPVEVGCKDAVYGQLAAGWRSPRSGTVIAGRIAWPYLRVTARHPLAGDRSTRAVKALAVVDPGPGVTVSIPPAERRRLSLDYVNLQPSGRFHVSDGAHAVTFKPCPRTQWPGGRTQFAGALIVRGAQCATIDIQPIGSAAQTRRLIPIATAHRPAPGC